MNSSVSVEADFWEALKAIVTLRGTLVGNLINTIDQQRQHANLSSAIRLFVLDYYRTASEKALKAKRKLLITGPQIRAARGFLAWDRRDLAKKAVVTIYMVERIEMGRDVSGAAMAKGLAAIKSTLEAEGIEFTDDNGVFGVRLHPKGKKAKQS